MAAVGVGPDVVAGNADNEPTCELIIAAGLNAAEETIRVVASVRLPEERITGFANDPFLACPQATLGFSDLAAAFFSTSTSR